MTLITTGSILPASASFDLVPEELVFCEVTPFDGIDFGDPVSASTFFGCPPFCGGGF